MRGPQTPHAAYRVTVALAGLGTAIYLVRVLWLPAARVEGEAVTLGVTFVLLAAVGVLRAVRSGARAGDVLMALGLVSSSLGWLYWSVFLVPLASPPYPSPADVLWMGLCPSPTPRSPGRPGPAAPRAGRSCWTSSSVARV